MAAPDALGMDRDYHDAARRMLVRVAQFLGPDLEDGRRRGETWPRRPRLEGRPVVLPPVDRHLDEVDRFGADRLVRCPKPARRRAGHSPDGLDRLSVDVSLLVRRQFREVLVEPAATGQFVAAGEGSRGHRPRIS
jgi:hypothetical protein